MAKYKNPNKATCVTINHSKGHTKIGFDEVKDVEATQFVDGLVKRGKLVLVEADKPAKPQAVKKDADPINDKSNQS